MSAPTAPIPPDPPFTGPFCRFDDPLAWALPAAFPTEVTPISHVVVQRRDVHELTWEKLLMASCNEQLSFLCAIFSPWNPEDDETLVEALRAGIKAGLFPALAKFASLGEDVKIARATAKALQIGVQHGRKLT